MSSNRRLIRSQNCQLFINDKRIHWTHLSPSSASVYHGVLLINWLWAATRIAELRRIGKRHHWPHTLHTLYCSSATRLPLFDPLRLVSSRLDIQAHLSLSQISPFFFDKDRRTGNSSSAYLFLVCILLYPWLIPESHSPLVEQTDKPATVEVLLFSATKTIVICLKCDSVNNVWIEEKKEALQALLAATNCVPTENRVQYRMSSMPIVWLVAGCTCTRPDQATVAKNGSSVEQPQQHQCPRLSLKPAWHIHRLLETQYNSATAIQATTASVTLSVEDGNLLATASNIIIRCNSAFVVAV